ncbi:MAG TPA: hypothetical protein VKY81_12575, partial [Natronosporangium sp.]|nr:hypothetical protein [Natronosporangium sp.]
MRDTVRRLLTKHGRTYAKDAGIRLADRPRPLYQLLVLSVLLSTRIRAGIAVAAARELFAAGLDSPEAMRRADWQEVVDALGRGHYVRYDESTATALNEGAGLLLDRYRGDLRRMRREAGGDVRKLERLLQEVPRLGPVGAAIFCREAQAVWPELRPYLDRRALEGARRLGLPTDPDELVALVPPDDLAPLAAGLVRVTLDKDVAREL